MKETPRIVVCMSYRETRNVPFGCLSKCFQFNANEMKYTMKDDLYYDDSLMDMASINCY